MRMACDSSSGVAEVRHRGGVSTANSDAVSIVPIWPAFVLPVLRVLQDGRTLHRKDVFDGAAEIVGLNPVVRAEILAIP